MTTDQKSISKRIGSTHRAAVARKELRIIFADDDNSLYFSKDSDLARRYDVTRLTILKIRDQMGVPSRSKRLKAKLEKIDTKNFTIKEIGQKLGVKYQNLYNHMTELKLPFKPDTPPIEALKQYNRDHKGIKRGRRKKFKEQ